MRIVYVPLEPYKDRYTLQLRDWNEREFKRLGVNYIIIDGAQLRRDMTIKTGAVLDAHGRSFFALSQIMDLVRLLSLNEITSKDFIFFEDMFHPGIEALAYIMDQQFVSKTARPKMGARCLAQTIDPDDFTHYTGMASWMRHYEYMTLKFLDVIFAASQEMLPFMTAAGWDTKVVVTGLPFGKQEVISRVERVRSFIERPKRVVFTSRVVAEKQPEFFLKVASIVKTEYAPNVEFAFLSGGRISYPGIDKAVVDGTVRVYPNLSKNEYYAMLNDSRVLFNCALQDWVSNTLSEADALGCNVIFPAYRSFPEALFNNHHNLYIPWSVPDAVDKVCAALDSVFTTQGKVSDYQDKSIERTIHAIHHQTIGEVLNWPHVYRKRITREAVK